MVVLDPAVDVDTPKSHSGLIASPECELFCGTVEATKDALIGAPGTPAVEQFGDINDLWEVTLLLQRRVDAVEARADEAHKRADPRILDALVARVHVGLEAQCAALYREQSEALTAQMGELLAEVRNLHWKALDDGEQTHRSSTGSTASMSARRSPDTRELSGAADDGAGEAAGQPEANAVPLDTMDTPKEGCGEASRRFLASAGMDPDGTSPSTVGPVPDLTNCSRLSAWSAYDWRELTFKRLDERVSALEGQFGQMASVRGNRCEAEDSEAIGSRALPRRGGTVQEQLQEMQERLEAFATQLASPAVMAEAAAAAATGNTPRAGVRSREAHAPSRLVSSADSVGARSTPVLPPTQEFPASRLLHSTSLGTLKRPLAAPPPRTEPEQGTVQAFSPTCRPSQQLRMSCCPAPGTAPRLLRGRTASPQPGVRALAAAPPLQELRGRCASAAALGPAASPAHAPGRSPSPPWHELCAGAHHRRSAPSLHRAPGVSPQALMVAPPQPGTPQSFARRQSSSPSPLPFASRTACQRTMASLRF